MGQGKRERCCQNINPSTRSHSQRLRRINLPKLDLLWTTLILKDAAIFSYLSHPAVLGQSGMSLDRAMMASTINFKISALFSRIDLSHA